LINSLNIFSEVKIPIGDIEFCFCLERIDDLKKEEKDKGKFSIFLSLSSFEIFFVCVVVFNNFLN
jgi:hypothetical protein